MEQLLHASVHGDMVTLQALIEQGADVDMVMGSTKPGCLALTPLTGAMAFGHNDAMRLLLSLGADPNAHPANTRPPLAVAASRGNAEAVQVLLAAGAKPLLYSPGGDMPAVLAARAYWSALESLPWPLEPGAREWPEVQGPRECFRLLLDAMEKALKREQARTMRKMRVRAVQLHGELLEL